MSDDQATCSVCFEPIGPGRVGALVKVRLDYVDSLRSAYVPRRPQPGDTWVSTIVLCRSCIAHLATAPETPKVEP